MIGICIFGSVALISGTILIYQKHQYDFLKSRREQNHSTLISQELQNKLKEFDDYKRRVDALTVKAGFKL